MSKTDENRNTVSGTEHQMDQKLAGLSEIMRTAPVREPELRPYANWISRLYGVDPRLVLEALLHSTPSVEDVSQDGGFRLLAFEPSPEEALQLTRPSVVLRILSTAAPEDLQALMSLLRRLGGRFAPLELEADLIPYALHTLSIYG